MAEYRTGGLMDFIDDVFTKASLPGIVAHAIKDATDKKEDKKPDEKKPDAATKSIADFAAEAQGKKDKKKEQEAAFPWWVWLGLLYIVSKGR